MGDRRGRSATGCGALVAFGLSRHRPFPRRSTFAGRPRGKGGSARYRSTLRGLRRRSWIGGRPHRWLRRSRARVSRFVGMCGRRCLRACLIRTESDRCWWRWCLATSSRDTARPRAVSVRRGSRTSWRSRGSILRCSGGWLRGWRGSCCARIAGGRSPLRWQRGSRSGSWLLRRVRCAVRSWRCSARRGRRAGATGTAMRSCRLSRSPCCCMTRCRRRTLAFS